MTWAAIRLFLAGVPRWVWLGIALVAIGGYGLHRFGSARFDAGAASVQQEWDATKARDAAAVAKVEKASDKIVEKVITQYVDRVQVIREKGKEIIRNVYIKIPADACPIDGGFRVQHDAAARMPTDPAPWGVPDYAAAPVDVRTAAATVAGNYESCHINAATLIAWQEWYRREQAMRGVK